MISCAIGKLKEFKPVSMEANPENKAQKKPDVNIGLFGFKKYVKMITV
jgi:hypothetical protein